MSPDTPQGITPENRPFSDCVCQALTISLAAVDLLEQLATGRLDPTERQLDIIESSLREAASLIHAPALPGLDSLDRIQRTAAQASSLLWQANPATLDTNRKAFISQLLRSAADRLEAIR